MQTLIEQNRVRDYERYEAHRRFEEATDIAERIGYPIDHTVHYFMRNGLAHGAHDTKSRPFRAQTEQARREGREKFTGVNEFEAIRREHEHQEALMVDAFGRGELQGTVLVKISPVPDAVRNGTANIDGYRRDLLRSFVRIYYRTDEGVACRLFSLDQSDQIGLAAIGDYLGVSVDDRSSEDVLADHALIDIDNVSDDAISELVGRTIDIYDRAIEMQTGGQFHAGSRMIDKNDALSLVMKHNSLLDEHMKGITDIMSRALDSDTKKTLLEDHRKRTAAAMDVVEQGGTVDSINDVAVTEQMASKDYGGECATDTLVEVGMNQGRSSEKSEEKWMTCPFCGLATKGDPCAVRLVCNMCAAEVRNGKVVSKGIGRANALALAEMQLQHEVSKPAKTKNQRKLSPVEMAKITYGPNVRVEYERSLGDAYYRVVHKDSGEELGKFKP